MSAAPDGEPQCHDEQRAQLYATLEARRQSSSVAAADVVRQQRQRTAWGERRSDGANPTWDGMLAGLRGGTIYTFVGIAAIGGLTLYSPGFRAASSPGGRVWLVCTAGMAGFFFNSEMAVGGSEAREKAIRTR